MAVKIDAFGGSINKCGEVLCGNRVEIIRSDSGVTAILADGRVGGAKANILTSFAVKMTSVLLSRGKPIDEIADMIADSQPAGTPGGFDYSAFTLIQVLFNGTLSVAQLETPDVILLRRGNPTEMISRRKTQQGKTIRTAVTTLKQMDTVIAVGSGIVNAAAGRNLKKGWQTETIAAYLANAYHPQISSERLVELLLSASSSLARSKPKNDLSALAFRVGS